LILHRDGVAGKIHQKLASGEAGPEVESAPKSEGRVRQMDDPDWPAASNIKSGVSGTGIYEDYFEGVLRLIEQRLEHERQTRLFVASANYN
jgi:hypothetical protein